MYGSVQQSLKYMYWGSQYAILFRTRNTQKQIFHHSYEISTYYYLSFPIILLPLYKAITTSWNEIRVYLHLAKNSKYSFTLK